MRSYFLFVLLSFTIQLCYFSGVFAQITFTREWVAGKRGLAHKNLDLAAVAAASEDSKDNMGCRSSWPAIEYLLELEKLREERCGSGVSTKPLQLVRKLNERFPKFFSKDDSLSSVSFPGLFDEESGNNQRKLQNQIQSP